MGVVSDNFPDISFIEDATIDEVMTQMINDYQEKYNELTGKNVSLAQADPYRLIMYACAVQMYQGMQYADSAGKKGLLKYSYEGFLDNLAALRGVQRIEATAATTTLQFSIESAIESVVEIPEGTRVTNGNDVFFTTDEYAEIPAGKLSVTVPATCTEAGTVGNGFAAGEFNILVNTLAYVMSVSNIIETTGGANEEDDESLADRIYHAPASYATTGSARAYMYHVKSVDTSISDVVVLSPSAGEVAIYFVCDNGSLPDEALIQKVEEYLMDSEIRPLTDHVTVQAANTSPYNVELTYYISEEDKAAVSTIQEDIDMAVSAYNAWQQEKIGRYIEPGELNRKVREAGAKRVEITSPAFTVLNKDTIAALGTVKVTYGGLEDG